MTLLLLAGCTQPPVGTHSPAQPPPPLPQPIPSPPPPLSQPTPSSQSLPLTAPNKTPVPELPKVATAFAIDGKPFRFLGSFGLCPWFLKDVPWHQDLVTTAKQSGIGVFHEMVPPFEKELGVYDEEGLRSLDLLLDQASKHGIYVTIEVMQGWQISHDEKDPYYNPSCMEGLIRDKGLNDAYKKRLEYLITHRNAINGRLYRDDPTILSWILIMEPILPPSHYPVEPSDVTTSELRNWIEEMTLYTKNLDPNHLVSVGITAGQAWPEIFDVPALDYIYAEDADARILGLNGLLADPYPLKLFSLGKPVVIHLAFSSGVWNLERIGTDYVWQANVLREETKKYFEAGASGVTICTWGSSLAKEAYKTYWSGGDLLFLYDITNQPIVAAFSEIATEFDTFDPTAKP